MLPIELIRTIQSFRADLYGCFGRREDALFEMVDTLLSGGRVQSLAHLSLEAGHRRTWGSVYAALARGHVDANLLSEVIVKRPLADGQPIYAVDVSVWSRCDAETSPARGYYYHPSRHSAGQPIVAGWAYQWLVQLSFARDSWTAPVDVRRVHPLEDDETIAVEQIRALLAQLGSSAAVPLFVFDAGYNSVTLTQGLAGVRAAILVRLRSDRCFFADPSPPAPGASTAALVDMVPGSMQGPDDLVAADDGASGRGRAVRHGPRPGLGRPASQAAKPRDARNPTAASGRPRHRDPRRGHPAAEPTLPPQGALALVVWPRLA